MDFPRTTKALREALEARGQRPNPRHGQCFLTDAQAVDAVVRDAGVAPGDRVVEVGTGTGLLTHVLCEAGAHVDTFDLDAEILETARSLREWPERVRFHAADALAGKHALSPELLAGLASARASGAPVRFVSNLPYHVATPLLMALLTLPDPPDTVTVMVQEEMAEKLMAAPGTDAYGPPSILRALTASGRVRRRLPPQVFWPAPAVRSALLHLVPRRPPALDPREGRAFSEFLLALFSRRRKVLSTALRAARPHLDAAGAAAACAAAGLPATDRPEDAPPEALLDLFHRTAPSP